MRISELIMYILAALSAGYGIFVRAAGSGTSFFLVWFALAVVLILFGISLHIRLWKKVPVWGRRIFMGIVVLGLAAFVIVEGCVISHMEDHGEDGLDYIIVLGAQVYKDGPSPVLQYRLDRAIEYLEENPDTYCILSGGEGANEPFPEAQGMADYMIRQGISEIRLVQETESMTTEENIRNSMKYVRKQGVNDACGISAGSMKLYLDNNMLREFFAEIKFILLSL